MKYPVFKLINNISISHIYYAQILNFLNVAVTWYLSDLLGVAFLVVLPFIDHAKGNGTQINAAIKKEYVINAK